MVNDDLLLHAYVFCCLSLHDDESLSLHDDERGWQKCGGSETMNREFECEVEVF